MNRSTLFLLIFLLSLSPLMAGGGQEEADDGIKTVTVWVHSGKGEERDATAQMLADFNSLQQGIDVELTQLPEGSYNEQVSAAALSGDLPDLLDFDGPNLYNYAWSGHIIPLDPYITPDLKQDLLPSLIDQGTYDGKIYALGTFDSGLSIWANTAYLKKAGVRIPTSMEDRWSFDEFNEALKRLQALPEVEYAIDFKMNYGQGEWYTYGFSPIVQAFGGDLIDRSDFQSADGVLNGPEAVAAMEWFQSLFEQGYANPAPAGDDSFYGSQTSALSFVGHWMKEPHQQGLGQDLALLPMPELGGGVATGMGSWCWGITANAKEPDTAWSFLNFMLSPNNILVMTKGNGAVPARFSALERSPEYQEGGLLKVFKDQLEKIAVARPQTPAYPTITVAFAEAVQNIVNGAPVQAELDKAVRTIDQDIADNNGYPTN